MIQRVAPNVQISVKIAITIVTLALVIRVIFLVIFPSPLLSDLIWNDAVAWNMVLGNGFTASQQAPYVPGVFRTPGYMTFIAGIYAIFGHNYVAALYGQALLDAFSALLLALIALPFFGIRVATLAGVLYAAYPYSAMLCTQLSQDIVLTFTVLLCLWLTTRAWLASHEPIEADNQITPYIWWFAVGLSLGIVALVKAFLLLYLLIPLSSIWILQKARIWKLKSLALIMIGITLVIGPWVIRNYLAFQSFPPLAVGGTGTNLTLLLVELKGGEKELVRSLRAHDFSKPIAPDYQSNYLSDLVDGKELIERERLLTRRALPEIKAHMPAYFVLSLKHIPRLWVTQYTLGRSPFITLSANIVSYLVIVPGLIGMLLVAHRWRELLPFYLSIIWITIAYAPYTAEARYTLPLRPIMIIFGAITLFWIIDKSRQQNTPELKKLFL